MVAKHKLKWMSIFTSNAYWMHEFMMLFVDPLIQWESLIFAVKHSMCHMECKVLTNDQNKHVSKHLP